MNRRVQSCLGIVSAFAIMLAGLASQPDILYGNSEPWFAEQLDPLRFLKRLQDVQEIGTGKREKKKFKRASGPAPPVGPNVILAVDASLRMQFDAQGHYYDLGLWPRADGTTAADDLGVSPLATSYRRRYDQMADDPGEPFTVGADRITVMDDQDAEYDAFFEPTRLAIARAGLAQAVAENTTVVRFGLLRSRYGAGAVRPTAGNVQPAGLTASPHSDMAGDLGGQQWKVTIPFTGTRNVDAAAAGSEVLVEADVSDSSDEVYDALQPGPDETGGLLPAGTALNDSTDSPVGELLADARAEAVRLRGEDLADYRECRNTAVVRVVGGAGGTVDPVSTASSFASVNSGTVTHRVPIFVIAIDPPAADVATLQAIATNSGGAYFEAPDAAGVAFAANYAVQAVHSLAADLDSGAPSVFSTTSPIVGTVDLSNASDIHGVPLQHSAITTPSGAPITQRANVILTAGFSLPGFQADLRAFRAYRPEADATRPLGYRFVKDGTPLWVARTPIATPRNIYTTVPGVGLVPFTTDATSVSALRPYLRVESDAAAADLIAFVRDQPLGAIIDSTPALLDPPSLDPPDEDYAAFAAQRATRRALALYGGNDGMIHAIDGRLGVEVWAFIPFNLLPKLSTLADGQPVDEFTYFVDSSPKVADVQVAGAWRTMLFIGQGLGGTFYQAFDVSDAGLEIDPESDSEAAVVTAFDDGSVIPFAWSFPAYSSFDHTIETDATPYGDLGASATAIEKTVGQTWSDPAVGQIQDATGPYVMMTGSGFLDETIEAQGARAGVRAGTTFYLLDVGTGSVHDSYDVGDENGKKHFKNALQADPTATGPVDSRFVTQVFSGDTEGNLWRFGITAAGGSAALAVPVRTHDTQQHHPLFASLALVNVGGATQHLFLATGMDIMPSPMKTEVLHMVGLKDDAGEDKKARVEFTYNMDRQSAVDGDERPTSAPAVAGDVVFYTTTTEFPSDPCRCAETSLYALTYDGNAAYDAGTGGTPSTKGKTKGRKRIEEIATWEGRATAPFVADQHLYFGVGDDLHVLGDPSDFNNGATAQGARLTSWREIRR